MGRGALSRQPNTRASTVKTILTLAFVALASVASAQSITDYQLKYYAVGASAPTQTESFTAAAVTCNQTPPSAGASTVNPTKVSWDDPSTAGRACIYIAPAGAPLVSLPVGSFEGTLTAINAAGSSPESARVGFTRLAAPAVLSGLRLTR